MRFTTTTTIESSKELEHEYVRSWLKCAIAVLAIVSFWTFARFTVDDAFITWIYGRNLVEVGVWNYNRSGADATQAYTNPIYAALSIVPALLRVDVVLFFKLVSMLLLGGFAVWIRRAMPSMFWPGLFTLALPVTMVHAFSGLSTFLYVALTSMLMVSLAELRFRQSLLIGSLLLMTRPEAWLFSALVPFYYLISPLIGTAQSPLTGARPNLAWMQMWGWKRACASGALFGGVMVTYFALHYLLFESFLPNTFYVKEVSQFHSIRFLVMVLTGAFALPILIAGRKALFALWMFFVVFVSYRYSHSDLMMDYSARFLFHLVFPSLFIGFYGLNRLLADSTNRWRPQVAPVALALVGAIFLLTGYAYRFQPSVVMAASNYYVRWLDVSEPLADAITTDLSSETRPNLVLGDAGFIPFDSRLPNLDIVGLGSAQVARQGMSDSLLNARDPSVLVLYGDERAPFDALYAQADILSWIESRPQFETVCKVQLLRSYHFWIYYRSDREYGRQITSACARAGRTSVLDEISLFKEQIVNPPWVYWRS